MSSQPNVEVTESFKLQVKEWFKLTEQKAAVSKDLKLLNGRIKELKDQITETMVDKGLDVCRVRNGKVQLYVTKSKAPLNKDTLKSSIQSYMATKEGQPNDPRAGELAEYILEKRGVKESYALRRSGGSKEGNDTATSELREEAQGDEEGFQGETEDV